jgi:tRNA U55 pseudouridine synthase TruB
MAQSGTPARRGCATIAGALSYCSVIEAPWLVNGGHGASLRRHTSGAAPRRAARTAMRTTHRTANKNDQKRRGILVTDPALVMTKVHAPQSSAGRACTHTQHANVQTSKHTPRARAASTSSAPQPQHFRQLHDQNQGSG